MSQYTIYQAKTHFSKLLQKALNGEEVIIANRDRPLLKLTVIQQPKRELLWGDLKGKIKISTDFNQSIDDFKDYS